MKISVYSIRDEKVGFLNPTFEQNDEVAMRNFVHAVQNSDTILKSHKSDFKLYKIGVFDTNTGDIQSIVPDLIIGGDEIGIPNEVR